MGCVREMSSGFNTDVRIGTNVFHVQTEDRGPVHPVIDTAVYLAGRVIHKRSVNYQDFASSANFTAEALEDRVESQHRQVIEGLRSGELEQEILAASSRAASSVARPAGVQIQLMNPSAWLSAGKVSLDVEVLRRADGQPDTAAQVEAMIEGALEPTRHEGSCDERGRVKIQFPLPPLGKGDLALVIKARGPAGGDEVRFTMRSRANETAAESTS